MDERVGLTNPAVQLCEDEPQLGSNVTGGIFAKHFFVPTDFFKNLGQAQQRTH